MDFLDVVKKRFSAKGFDSEKKLSSDQLDTVFEAVRFAPSSFGLQPFKVVVVSDADTKGKLQPVSYDQPQVGSCSHLLVFCAVPDVLSRLDKYKELMADAGSSDERIEGFSSYVKQFNDSLSSDARLMWAKEQTFIALSHAMNAAASIGVDSCPMGGFIPGEYSKILGLDEGLVPVVVLPLGFASDDPKPKIRFSRDDLFFTHNP